MSGLLEGKRVLVTGVLTEASIAFSVARLASRAGRDGGAQRLRPRPVASPSGSPDGSPGHRPSSASTCLRRTTWPPCRNGSRAHVDHLDGVLHAIGFAPAGALGSGVLDTRWADVGTALQVSTWSYVALARACTPLLTPGASYVGLDFDARVAWPSYDWMGVAKAGLESANRYLARDLGPLGVRSNLVAAGPLKTMAAKSIPGFERFEQAWDERAPLGWDVHDSEPVAQACVALLSDWFPKTSGSIVYVDGGFSAVGV